MELDGHGHYEGIIFIIIASYFHNLYIYKFEILN